MFEPKWIMFIIITIGLTIWSSIEFWKDHKMPEGDEDMGTNVPEQPTTPIYNDGILGERTWQAIMMPTMTDAKTFSEDVQKLNSRDDIVDTSVSHIECVHPEEIKPFKCPCCGGSSLVTWKDGTEHCEYCDTLFFRYGERQTDES